MLYFSDFSKWGLLNFSVLQCIQQSENHCFILSVWKQRSFHKAAQQCLAEMFWKPLMGSKRKKVNNRIVSTCKKTWEEKPIKIVLFQAVSKGRWREK